MHTVVGSKETTAQRRLVGPWADEFPDPRMTSRRPEEGLAVSAV